MANAGKEGHIFAGKYLPFKNEDITQMIGVYILDGLAPYMYVNTIHRCISLYLWTIIRQLLEWEVTRRTPSETLLREA